MASVSTIAQVCHEVNRALQAHQADPGIPVSPPWWDLDEETMDSIRQGVEGVLAGNSPEASHRNWCEFKRAHGWVYGPVKDAEAKTHPCLVPYAELSPDQRLKDDLFVAVVKAFLNVPWDEDIE